MCCSTYLCIHWLILVCVLTRDQTHNLGTLGRCSNHLSYPARAVNYLKLYFSVIALKEFSVGKKAKVIT